MSDDLMPLVADEFKRLRDALATLSPEQWQSPSLCEGWTIRHVIAHLTMPARVTPTEFGALLAAENYDFNALSNKVADRDSALPIERLLGDLVSDTLANWTTPDGGPIGALTHVVIHGLDATIPTGLGPIASPDAVRLSLDNLAGGGTHAYFGVSLEGRHLVANDIDWAYGNGTTETAPAHLILLRLAGRSASRPQAA